MNRLASTAATEINDSPQNGINTCQPSLQRKGNRTPNNSESLCKASTTPVSDRCVIMEGVGKKYIPCLKDLNPFSLNYALFRRKIFVSSHSHVLLSKIAKRCLTSIEHRKMKKKKLTCAEKNWPCACVNLTNPQIKDIHPQMLKCETLRLLNRGRRLHALLLCLYSLHTMLETRPHWPCASV